MISLNISYIPVYGVNPSFIFCTATSANAREHCMELASLPELELIEKDGSPSSAKLFVLLNPEDNPLFAEHGLRRKLCELVLSYTRDILIKTAPHLVEAISSYRGGYNTEDRRVNYSVES